MKKTLILIAIILAYSQLFAQAGKKIEFENAKATKDTKCPDYVDCNTGEIQYFEYKKDMVVDAPEVCGPLGVKACTILKGRCNVDRSSENVATVTLACKPFQCPIAKPYKIIGTSPKDPTCKAPGNSCFHSALSLNEKDISFSILVTPIVENGICVAIKLTYATKKGIKRLPLIWLDLQAG